MKQPLQQLLKKSDGTLIELPGQPPAGDGQLADSAPAGQAPVTPMAAAQSGVNPDAAKMAGTPAQSSGPVLLRREPSSSASIAPGSPQAEGSGQPGTTPPGAAQPQQKLSDVLRTQNNTAHVQGEAPRVDPEEARKQADAQRRIATFGSLGSRIHNLIESGGYLAPREDGAGSSSDSSDGFATAGLTLGPGAEKLAPAAREAVEKMVAGGATPELVAAAKQALAGDDPFKYVSRDVGAGVGAAATAATPDQLMLDADTVSQLGYAPADLAGILGVPEAQLGQISLQQMQQMLQENIQTEHSSAQAAKQRAVDPAAGPNERAQARAELRRLGATGVYASEQQMQQLADEIQSSGEVEFNGRVMRLEDILSDENMTALVDEYVSSDPNSDLRKELRKNEPALAAFLDRHEAGLREALVNLDDSAQTFEKLQSGGAAALNSLKTAGLDDSTAGSLMKELLGDAWKPGYMTTAVDMAQFPGLAAVTDPATMQRMGMDPGAAGPQFAELARLSPAAAGLLAKMTPEQLKATGLGTRDSGEWASYMTYVKEWEAAKKLDWTDTAAVQNFLFGGKSLDHVQGLLTSELGKEKMGQPSQWLQQMRPLLDKDSDGRIDSLPQIQQNVTGALGSGAPGDAISLDPARRGPGQGPRTLASILGPAAADGKIDLNEVNQKVGELPLDIPPEMLVQFANNPNVTPEARERLFQVAEARKTEGIMLSVGFRLPDIQLVQSWADAGTVPPPAFLSKIEKAVEALAGINTHAARVQLAPLQKILGTVRAQGDAAVAADAAKKSAADAAAVQQIYTQLMEKSQRTRLSADEIKQLDSVAVQLGKPKYSG